MVKRTSTSGTSTIRSSQAINFSFALTWYAVRYRRLIDANSGIKTSDMAKKLGVSSATVKRMLDSLLAAKLIESHGIGPGPLFHTAIETGINRRTIAGYL